MIIISRCHSLCRLHLLPAPQLKLLKKGCFWLLSLMPIGLIPVDHYRRRHGRGVDARLHVLMHAYMNEAALLKTLETGEAHLLQSQPSADLAQGSHQRTGATVQQLLIDDDQDCLWMKVKVAGAGASCHVGYRSCFYRQISPGEGGIVRGISPFPSPSRKPPRPLTPPPSTGMRLIPLNFEPR